MHFERHQSAVVLASAITVAAFVGTTVYTQYKLAAVDTLSSTMAGVAIPSVEYLARGAIRLQTARRLIDDALASPPPRSAALTAARTELRALGADIDRYLQLTPLPGEHDLWTAIQQDVGRADEVAAQVLKIDEAGDESAAARLFRTEGRPAFDQASHTLLTTMEYDVRESERLARDVRDVRQATTRSIIVLDGFAALVAALTAIMALRAARDHDRLLKRHSDLLSERVAELDRFAGRVAHDILSPLDAVGFGLALVDGSADAAARPHIERSRRAVQRVQQLVDGLLRFARAGAQSDESPHARVDEVLANIAADFAAKAQDKGIDLRVDAGPTAQVMCSVGVLTSLVQNLVANALKYMGDRSVRRVTVRASADGGMVRVEVEDTGPGIPPDVQKHIFEPFVRGAHENVEGLGLGLATVRRLAKAHGGTVGVRSTPGAGSVFWFELPRTSASAPRMS